MNALPRIAPVVHTSVNEAVYVSLRDHIMRGAYAAGQVLGIQELSTALGTSMMPVREALRRLEVQRALETTKSRSMRIPLISLERLEDICRTRVLVEGTLTEWAVLNIGKDSLHKLRSLSTEIGQALDSRASLDAGLEKNQQFHFEIYRAANSPSMLAIVESLWLQSGPYLRATRELMHSTARPADELHAAIVQSIEQGDAVQARAIMERDVSWAFDRLRAAQSMQITG